MGKITVELIRKRAEHNEGEIQSLEEISLHQEKIEKIELLNKICRNLKILMLQNNSIGKIENLNRLKHLEYLNLALNSIEIIENLEGCESLKKLDLTLNFIGKISSVQSLIPNYNLEQLYLVGNPCHDFPGYRSYVIALLPQLKHLDGTEITKSERLLAAQKFKETQVEVMAHEEAFLKGESVVASSKETDADADGDKNGGSSRISPKVEEVLKIEGSPIENDTEAFWQKVTENSPATRLEINRRLEKQENERVQKTSPKLKGKVKKLFTDEGHPLNLNEPKLSFTLHDELERNQIVLDLAVPRFLCTTLLDADVQPNYVRVTIKGKVFQLVLPDEVRPDSSYAQRSQTSGHLILTMPKVHENSLLVWRRGSGQLIDLTKNKGKVGKARSSSRTLAAASSENSTNSPRFPAATSGSKATAGAANSNASGTKILKKFSSKTNTGKSSSSTSGTGSRFSLSTISKWKQVSSEIPPLI